MQSLVSHWCELQAAQRLMRWVCPERTKPMDRTYVVTGAASGIGAATARYCRGRGGRVIACDLQDADVVADLATAEGARPWSTG